MTRPRSPALRVLPAALGVAALGLAAGAALAAERVELPSDFVSPVMPADVAPNGAPDASLAQAAIFAWREWIALQWPALSGKRALPDRSASPGNAPLAPRVWETFRARVETYPGSGSPVADAKAADYDFDAPPRYVYDAKNVGSWSGSPGSTRPCSPRDERAAPWHNLDEPAHDGGHAGLSDPDAYPGQQILLETKVNRTSYVYVVSRGWYGEAPMRLAKKRTGEYVRSKLNAPPAAKEDDPEDRQLVSFPVGAMELKAGWRRLGAGETRGRFITAPVRYYERRADGVCHHDSGTARDHWGLVAMHIMHKTSTAPYFVWATFEHVDNLVANERDADGRPVRLEDDDGTPKLATKDMGAAYTPRIDVVAATAEDDQQVKFAPGEPVAPGTALYFRHQGGFGLPEVPRVVINARLHRAPPVIAEVNRLAQAEIRSRFRQSPLQYYRLVSVQWKPLTKAPGEVYHGPEDPAVYYAANVIIEPSPVHQAFSGQFTSGFSKSSDYLHRTLMFLNPPPNPGAPVFLNTFYNGKGYLSGGCMGCHGARQAYGTDWSFILDRQRVTEPEFAK